MRKSFFVFVAYLLFSSHAFAGGNVFCNNQPSSTPFCMTVARVMYQGFLEGYANRMIQYKQEEGITTTKEQEKLMAKKLVPYDTLYKYFNKCGESEQDTASAQACIFSNLQNDIQKKMGQKF